MDELDFILQRIATIEANTVRRTYGIIADDSPLTAIVGAATDPVPVVALNSYSPAVGDHVAILEVGADRFVLGKTTATPWRNGVGGVWQRSAVQSIPNNTVTDISWDVEATDSDGFLVPHATTATTLVVPAGLGGLYAVTASVVWGAAPAAPEGLLRFTTGGNIFDFVGRLPTSRAAGTIVVAIVAGGGLVVAVQQSSGGALNVQGRLSFARIGP